MGDSVIIGYDSLFDLLRREKSREELQKLDEGFYAEVATYLKDQDRLAFQAPAGAEHERIKIQAANVRKIVRELYERRERKIVSLALYKARSSSSILDISALLAEERLLFERVCDLLIRGREAILESVLQGKTSIADLLVQTLGPIGNAPGSGPAMPGSAFADGAGQGEESPESVVPEARVKVKVRMELPEFLGRDMEVYGPYKEGEVAQVSKTIALVLTGHGAADLVEDPADT